MTFIALGDAYLALTVQSNRAQAIERMFVVVLLPSGMVVHREIFEYIEVY